MIDKLEAMIERGTSFRKGPISELYRAARQGVEGGTFRRSRYYRAIADLRPHGFDAILHMEQKRYGTHKVELLETGKKGMREIESTLDQIVDHDPRSYRIGRIDLATDVTDVALSWFREHVYIQYKQFVCGHGKLVEAEYSEMGKKVFQTLYFGKRPCCVRIYDKVAERLAHFELWKKRQIRAEKSSWLREIASTVPESRQPFLLPEFPSSVEWLKTELPDASFGGTAEAFRFPVVTRVENQLGGRVPEQLGTVAKMKTNVREFNPFGRINVLSGNRIPPGLFDRTADGCYRFRVLDWCAFMFVNQNWNVIGASQMRQMLNRDRNGRRYLEKMTEFIPVDESTGIAPNQLFERYQESISRQLAA